MAAENIETVNVEANVEQTNADDAETEVEAETIQEFNSPQTRH